MTATVTDPGTTRPPRAPHGATAARRISGPLSGTDRPRLARHVRMTFSEARQGYVLLLPETVVVLRGSSADILALCDGTRTVDDIVAELGARYRTVPEDEVCAFLARLVARRCVELRDG